MDEQRQWHRLFGMSWIDFFTGLPVIVEVEKDLSLKQQLLDVVLIRKGHEPLPCRLPDGFEDLAGHNLISFKSYQETLDGWALSELVGHYVNYRKQVSPDFDNLLPESDFRLFAVSVRYPHNLAQQVELASVQPGVYQVRHFSGAVRIVVVHQLPQADHNAMLHLFSAKGEQIRYGAEHYRPRSSQTSTFLHQLFQKYQSEGVSMPFSKEEFIREAIDQILREVPTEKLLEVVPLDRRLESVPAEKRLEGVPLEKRLEGVPLEKRLEGVPLEKRLEGMSVDDLLQGLSPQTLEALRRRLQGEDPSTRSS